MMCTLPKTNSFSSIKYYITIACKIFILTSMKNKIFVNDILPHLLLMLLSNKIIMRELVPPLTQYLIVFFQKRPMYNRVKSLELESVYQKAPQQMAMDHQVKYPNVFDLIATLDQVDFGSIPDISMNDKRTSNLHLVFEPSIHVL